MELFTSSDILDFSYVAEIGDIIKFDAMPSFTIKISRIEKYSPKKHTSFLCNERAQLNHDFYVYADGYFQIPDCDAILVKRKGENDVAI